MIRINLLPHRIAKRRQRRQQFYALAFMSISWQLVFLYTLRWFRSPR